MTDTQYRITRGSLIVCLTLFAFHVSAQSPPTATEAFNLRIKCKKMSDQKAQEFMEANTAMKWEYVAAWNTSRYDPASNRCYGRIYEHIEHTTKQGHFDNENDVLFDLQIDDLLATATIKNSKKAGEIWDKGYKKPWVPSCSANGCAPDFGEKTWEATEDYMNEMMADPRKQ